MSPKTTSTALAAILVLAGTPLLAQTATDAPAADSAPAAEATQDGTSEATPEAAAEAPAADAPVEAAPAEAPANGEPPVGAYYPRSTHGDWTLRCIKTADAADPCELYQLMKDGEGNSVAEITLIPLQNGAKAVAGATIVSPLETDLTQGIGLRIDAGQVKAYPFNFCAPVGCVSRVGLTGDELGGLKRGKAATVSLLPYGAGPDQVVNLSLSLTGFTAGYAELEKAVAEMRDAAAAAESAGGTEAADAPAAQ